MSVDKTQALLKVISKIQMFSELAPESAALVLKSCEFRTSETGETVCKIADPSDDFSILLSGSLGVYDRQNTQVGSVEPVAPVGEMGLFTGQPRSATVRVTQPSTLLVLKRAAFARLCRQQPEIYRHVNRNVIHILVQRLQDSRSRYAAAERELEELEITLQEVQAEAESLSSD